MFAVLTSLLYGSAAAAGRGRRDGGRRAARGRTSRGGRVGSHEGGSGRVFGRRRGRRVVRERSTVPDGRSRHGIGLVAAVEAEVERRVGLLVSAGELDGRTRVT